MDYSIIYYRYSVLPKMNYFHWTYKVSLAYWFRRFCIHWFLRFSMSSFLRCITKFPFHVFCKILIPYSRCPKHDWADLISGPRPFQICSTTINASRLQASNISDFHNFKNNHSKIRSIQKNTSQHCKLQSFNDFKVSELERFKVPQI